MHVTNTVPQMQPFNAGIWLALESYALENARDDQMRISVFTGPFLLADDPVREGVRIPRSFWKVIAFIHDETRKLCATGYTMSQEDFLRDEEFVFGKHKTSQTRIADIERRAGLSFGPLAALDPLKRDERGLAAPLTDPSQIRFSVGVFREDVMAKRALLVGINRYQIAGADLRGCVNDVKDLSAALVEFHGFKKGDITVLTDGAATKKAMQAGIKALVRDSKKGDVALLHYSGHGSNVPDDNGDEADGRDEILCPTDLDWDDPLRDDWLRTTLDGLRAGVNLTVIMDCCHSGTNTRAVLPPDAPVKQRYLPSPVELEGGGIGTERAEESHERAARARRARRARPGTSSRRSCPRCSSPAAATPRRRPTPSSTAGTTARSRLRWSRRFARAGAGSRTGSCTTARRPCSRPGSSSRCRSSKGGPNGSTSRCLRCDSE